MPGKDNALDEYYSALDRLKSGKPQIVSKGTRITNDAVSLEAGRGKGSIKKSRIMFNDLIATIKKAADEQSQPDRQYKDKLDKTKANAEQYRRELEAALAREVSLLKQLYDLKKQMALLNNQKVVPIRDG